VSSKGGPEIQGGFAIPKGKRRRKGRRRGREHARAIVTGVMRVFSDGTRARRGKSGLRLHGSGDAPLWPGPGEGSIYKYATRVERAVLSRVQWLSGKGKQNRESRSSKRRSSAVNVRKREGMSRNSLLRVGRYVVPSEGSTGEASRTLLS